MAESRQLVGLGSARRSVTAEPAVRKVLQIAFDFPPRRTSGVYRPTAMAKYLRRYGWHPTVLTARTKPGETLDPTLLAKLPPEVRVVRTPYWAVDWWDKPAAQVSLAARAMSVSPNGDHKSGLRQFLRFCGGLARSVLYFPDETVGWVPFGLEQAMELHLNERYHAIYTTSPQRSTHLFGLLLKHWFDIPWVAEFRDPWPLPNRPLRRKLEYELQAKILRSADAVVPVTSHHAKALSTVYGIPPERVTVITNGFDEDDFAHAGGVPEFLQGEYIHLTHFGTVYPNFSGRFFEALLALARESPDLKHRLRVNIVGFPDECVQRYAGHAALREIVRLYGFLEHSEAIQAMRASHCLLLFWADPKTSRLAVAGKTYEYLRSGTPILALTTEGGIQELLERTRAGRVVHPDDIQGIEQALRELLGQPHNRQPQGSGAGEDIARFNYEHLAGQLAKVLNRVAAHAT